MTGDRESRRPGFVDAILSGLAQGRPARRRPAPEPEPEGHAPADGPGHETSDVNVVNTALVMAGLMLSAAVAVGIMAWLMRDFTASQRRALPSLTPQQTTRVAPPPPNLQAKPYADIDAEKAAQAKRLTGYAYTDPARQRARIPIDRAEGLIVGRTLDP